MSVCPWCKAQNPPGAEVCLHCGKRASDHPSIAGRDLDNAFDDAFDGTAGPAPLDIELGGGPIKRQGVADMAGGSGGLKTFGDDWGEEPADLPGIDLAGPARPNVVASAPRLATSSPAPRRESGSSSLPPAATPSGRGPAFRQEADARSSLEIDRYEVLALADYGDEPKSILQVVPYAIRVKLRQRELRRLLTGVRSALAEAESRRDERYIELGELLRPHVEGNPEFSSFAGTLGEAEKTKHTREAALADASSAFRERAAAIDAEIAAQDAPRAGAEKVVEEKTRLSEAAEQLRAKHEARRKRVDIEVRAAAQTLERPETLVHQREAARALIAAAQNEKTQRAAEEAQATKAAQAAEAQAAAARRSLAEVDERVAALRTRRKEVEKEFARQGQIRSQGIDAAGKEVRHALLEIGRRLATGSLAPEGAEVRRKAIREAEAQVKRLQLDLEKHLRALDAANDPEVRRGLIVLGAVIFVLVTAFIAWRALRTNPYDDPKPTPTAPATPK